MDYNRCVIDLLHLFLRITDVLLDQFIKAILLVDEIGPNTKINIESHRNIAKYYEFLTLRCKIRVIIYNNTKDSKLTRDFTGPEKLKIFKLININNDFSSIYKSESVHKLWKSFLEIYNGLRDNSLSPELTKEKTKNWFYLFKSIYLEKHITPYIHSFCSHLYQFQRLYGDINIFNLQGNLLREYFVLIFI